MGIQRKNNGFLMDDEDEKYRVAVHEIGHTFMALYNPPVRGLGVSLDSESLRYGYYLFNPRELKKNLLFHPEQFLTPEGIKSNFYNYMNVHKVTILPYGNSLGHTAMLNDKDVFSWNKQDIIKFIGNRRLTIKSN